jgi:UDP-glucose 6-dehydrogenase
MRISVIGTGHLGATHAASLAVVGHQLMGVGRDPSEDICRVERVAAAVRAGVRAVA